MPLPQKKIGLLFGMEDTFPWALIRAIDARGEGDIVGAQVELSYLRDTQRFDYALIVDRISHEVPFYRTFLKAAAARGVQIVNNPFWWGADDKFFNYALASKIGVAVPRTVVLPHKRHPPGTTDLSMRNLTYPLNWDEVFEYIRFPAFLKPFSGGGWKSVYKVHSPDEFFTAYNDTGDLCMTLQQGIEFEDYFRCYVVGQQKVHVMQYDPRRPHAERYVKDAPPIEVKLNARVLNDALTLCRALGYDLNTVEFAVQDGIPYAIDFLNPAPDADYDSVGPQNFEWIVDAVAKMAIAKAQSAEDPAKEMRWSAFLRG